MIALKVEKARTICHQCITFYSNAQNMQRNQQLVLIFETIGQWTNGHDEHKHGNMGKKYSDRLLKILTSNDHIVHEI